MDDPTRAVGSLSAPWPFRLPHEPALEPDRFPGRHDFRLLLTRVSRPVDPRAPPPPSRCPDAGPGYRKPDHTLRDETHGELSCPCKENLASLDRSPRGTRRGCTHSADSVG